MNRVARATRPSRRATAPTKRPPARTKNSKNPRNITYYALKPHPTTTQRIATNPWAVGRVTPCAPLLASQRTSFPNRRHPNASLLRNTLCKCLVLQHVTFASKAPKMPGHVATGFPLPSTGRGIEGEGWSYPEPPPVSSCISPIRGPGLKQPRAHRKQATRHPARASGGGRSRAATPFACGAGTLWRGFAEGLRMTLLPMLH